MNTFNFSNVEERDFSAIPAGKYKANVYEVNETETSNDGKLPAGTPGITVAFKISEGEHEGRQVFTNFWFAPDGHGSKEMMDSILFGFLKAVGYEEKKLRSGTFKLDPDDLEGRECVVKVTQYTYQDEKRNGVKYVQSADTALSSAGGSKVI